MNRIDWDQYFMAMAHLAAVRSHDAQTQVGCVIVNEDNHIVSIGYNGFPANTKDEKLPIVRPYKYPYMIHAEQNALSNITNKDKNIRAYVTGYPCSTCSKLLWQSGIRKVIVDQHGVIYSMSEDDIKIINFLIENGLQIKELDFQYEIFGNLSNKLKYKRVK